MKYRLFKSFSSLAREITRTTQARKDIFLSFDVFDTLVHRRIAPDAIIDAVGREIAEHLQANDITPVCAWLDARDQAYAQAGRTFVERGLDMDAHLDDIVLPWVRCMAGGAFAGDAAMAQHFIEREIMFEKWAVYPNEIMLRLLRALRADGVRVVLTSDMYLGRKYVARLLEHCGYAGMFDDLLVSCDSGTLKRTGQMFAHLARTLNVAPDMILHVGDNLLGDGVMAARAGLRSFVIRDRQMCARNARLDYDFRRQKSDPAWKGICAAAYAQAPPGTKGSAQESFGIGVMGPVLAPFVHAVAQRCKDSGVERVFFVSREGLILKAIYDEVAPLVFGAHVPEAVYFGASRLTTFLAAIHGDLYGAREIDSAFANASHYSLRNLVQPLQMEEGLLKTLAAQAGIADVDRPLPENFATWTPLSGFLDNPQFRAIVAERAKPAREGLLGYLEAIGFLSGGRVAFVDIGWGGQIQENIAVAVESHPGRPQIHGLYMGLNGTGHTRKARGRRMEGLVCDAGEPDFFGQAALEFVFLFEIMVRAPHGTIIGYAGREAGFAPVCKDADTASRLSEIRDEPRICAVQAGVRDYARHYARVARILDIRAADTLPYARSTIARAVRFPSALETQWLMTLQNISDLGSSLSMTLGSTYSSGSSHLSLWRPRQMIRTLKQVYWPYGVVRASLGRAGQAIIAFRKGRYALSVADLLPMAQDVRQSEVEPLPAQAAPPVPIYPFEKQGLAAEKAMAQVGREAGQTVDLHEGTRPLRGLEMLPSHLVYRALRHWAARRKRLVPSADGVSLTGLLMRDYGRYHPARLLRGAARRALRRLRLRHS